MLTHFETVKIKTANKVEKEIDINSNTKYRDIISAIRRNSKNPEEVIKRFNNALEDEDKFFDLRKIHLKLIEYKEYVIPFLNIHPEIVDLHLSNNIFDVETSEYLFKNIKNIKSLSIDDSLICAEGFKLISENKNLIELSIVGTSLLRDYMPKQTPESSIIFGYIANSTNIKYLDISHSYYLTEDIINLCKKQTITYLKMSGSIEKLQHKALIALAENPVLEVLHLDTGSIGDEGVSIIAQTKSIKKLVIFNNNGVTDEAALSLSRNKSINELKAACCNISFDGAKALINNLHLNKLDIDFNNITPHEAEILLDIAEKRSVKLELSLACEKHKRLKIK